MSRMLWGENNTKSFLKWCDYSRRLALANLPESNTGNLTPFSDSSDNFQSIQYKNEVLKIIKRGTKISLIDLYKELPNELIFNETTKFLILSLFFNQNIILSGTSTNTGLDDEIDYIAIFNKDMKTNEPIQKESIKQTGSAMNRILDNNYKYEGRKLEFDKKERGSLNTSLKNDDDEIIANKINDNEIVDVRDYILNNKSVTPKSMEVKKVETPIFEPVKENKKVKYISIPKPAEPIIKVVQNNNIINPIRQNEYEFSKLDIFDIYLIMEFLKYSKKFSESKSLGEINYLLKVCDLECQKLKIIDGSDLNLITKIIYGISFLVLVGFIVLSFRNSKSIRSKAKKEFKKIRHKTPYLDIKNEFSTKYPDFIKFN